MVDASLQNGNSLRLLGLTFSTGVIILNQLLGLLPGKLVHCIAPRQCFSSNSILHIYKSTIRPCIEYYRHIWSAAAAIYPEILGKIQRSVSNFIGPNLASWLQSFTTGVMWLPSVFSYKYFHGSCSNKLSSMMSRLREFKCTIRLATRFYHFTL